MDDVHIGAYFLMAGFSDFATLQKKRVIFGRSRSSPAIRGGPFMQAWNIAAPVIMSLPHSGPTISGIEKAIGSTPWYDRHRYWLLHLMNEATHYKEKITKKRLPTKLLQHVPGMARGV